MKKNKNYFVTFLSKDFAIIERPYSYDGNDFVEVLAYDKPNNRLESVGTSYDDMQYYFNKNYVVFLKGDDIEFVFDNNKFDFVNYEELKAKALSDIMDKSLINVFAGEKEIMQLEECNEVVKSLLKKLN